MIIFSNEEGIIPPQGIKNLDGNRDTSIKLPHIAIGIYSEKLVKAIVKKYRCKKIGYASCANTARPIYELNYKGKKFTLFVAGISGPWIATDIEELNSNGVDTFILFGNCGVLDRKIDDLKIIIPNMAIRDEGISYHYVEDSEMIEISDKYKQDFIDILNKEKLEYVQGTTWTTDAFYRETREKMNNFKKKGAICVEMEAASIAAVCKYKNLDYFTFFYAGDNLDSDVWDKRSISQSASFNKKLLIPKLAFDLAYSIEKGEENE